MRGGDVIKPELQIHAQASAKVQIRIKFYIKPTHCQDEG